jgi:hypothetical protein
MRTDTRRMRRMLTFAAVASLQVSVAFGQVTRVEIASREPADSGQPAGSAGPYEILRGRIHGEVDPFDARNAIIQDLQFAPRNARGKVEYVATFALAKPIDLTKASGMLVYQVVNRGNGTVTPSADGHISLVSGWQGDVVPTSTNQTIVVPIAKHPDGSPLTGPVLARFYNVPEGTNTVSIRLSSMNSGPPVYPPLSLDQARASLTMHTAETSGGVKTGNVSVPTSAWAFADCRRAAFPREIPWSSGSALRRREISCRSSATRCVTNPALRIRWLAPWATRSPSAIRSLAT